MVSFASGAKDAYAEGRRIVWPSFSASVHRMLAIVAVFLVLGAFALATRFAAIWVRDLVAAMF
jgi:preprotein translocase subunit SecE